MALTASQRRIVSLLLGEASHLGASARPTKALLEAGIVESGLRNLPYGDRDSVGVLQQRPSQGWAHAMDPQLAAKDFLTRAIAINKGFHGSAGALAQAVQRSAFPGRYDAHSAEAQSLLGQGGHGRLGAFPRAAAPSQSQAPEVQQDAGTGVASLLAQLTGQRPQVPITAPAAPAFSARAALPQGYQPPTSSPPAPQPDLQSLLTEITASQTPSAPSSTPAAAGPAGRAASAVGPTQPTGRTVKAPGARGGLSFPLARHGKIIGVPYQGTHTQFGNWQSDNAIDISTPKGTPVVAVADGRIGSRIGPLDSSNPQLAGQRVYVEGKGNQWYYAHLSRIVVKPGQRVRKGQVIGYSGVANGVAHLHIAAEKGNPLHQFGG